MATDDDRFAELIRGAYGVTVSQPAKSEDALHAVTRPPKPEKAAKAPRARDWFSLDRAIDAAQPDVEPFAPDQPLPIDWRLRPLVVIGLAWLVLAVTVGVLWAVGVGLPIWLRWAGGLAVGAGLACLLFSLPRRETGDDLDDGAVL